MSVSLHFILVFALPNNPIVSSSADATDTEAGRAMKDDMRRLSHCTTRPQELKRTEEEPRDCGGIRDRDVFIYWQSI